MKNYLSFIALLILPVLVNGQNQFDADDFDRFRASVKDIGFDDLCARYDQGAVYYSGRTFPSDPFAFDYIDSIDQKIGLKSMEKYLIGNFHFMVSERLSHQNFAGAFDRIFQNDLPLFLSTDFFLHTLHCSYDEILKTLEVSLLEPNLLMLLTDLREELPTLAGSIATKTELLQPVKDVDLYLSIALTLLKDEPVLPVFDDPGLYELLLAAIRKHEGIIETGLFSDHIRKLDMSQFKPRGHYTDIIYTSGGERDLSNYFMTMIWLGRIDFLLTPPPAGPGEEPWSEQDLRRMALDAMILNQLIETSGKKDNLLLHEKVTDFMVGPPDNLTPLELKGITDSMNIDASSLLNEQTYEAFRKKLDESNDYGQRILSNYFIVDGEDNPAELPVSYKLLGQKFILDSYVFSQVVYDRIVFEDTKVKRMLPDPLDVLFVLGNEDALELLENDVNTWHYGYKLAELRYLTDSYTQDFWEGSVYNFWLDAIRELSPAPQAERENYPFFMQTTNWQQEKMNTQLASWTELRHDNVLYAKQSYTGGASCSFPHIYVEPYPGFFGKLESLANKFSTFFRDELTPRLAAIPSASDELNRLTAFFDQYAGYMKNLRVVTEKELRQEALSDEEILFLDKFYKPGFICGEPITGWYLDLFYNQQKAAESDFIVVDLHTQPTDENGNPVGKVLHAGTGAVNLGVFVTGAPDNGYRLTAFTGPVMSFHTKIEKNFYRLDDEEWEKLFVASTEPYDGRPDWVNSYLTDEKGERRSPGRNLKGISYSGTGIGQPPVAENLSWFISWPNPATDETYFQFFMNRREHVRMDLFDMQGRHLGLLTEGERPPGEHYLRYDTTGLPGGVYLVRLTCGKNLRTVRLVVGK